MELYICVHSFAVTVIQQRFLFSPFLRFILFFLWQINHGPKLSFSDRNQSRPGDSQKHSKLIKIHDKVTSTYRGSQFLDFNSMPKWHQGFTLTRLSPDKSIIEAGDKLKIVADGTTLIPTVVVSNNLAQ